MENVSKLNEMELVEEEVIEAENEIVETIDESYDWNWELVMKANSMLNNVWRLFDDIFLFLL